MTSKKGKEKFCSDLVSKSKTKKYLKYGNFRKKMKRKKNEFKTQRTQSRRKHNPKNRRQFPPVFLVIEDLM